MRVIGDSTDLHDTTDVHEVSTRAMGTTVRVTAVDADEVVVQRALWRVHELECRWSRFRASSEISRLNAANGKPCIVSEDTALLVHHMVRAHRLTGGLFDPTVLGVVEDLGYATSWPLPRIAGDHPTSDVPGCGGITVDRGTGLVWLPPGVALDPGGLGKGLAADIVAQQVIDDGARGVLVDIGGDIRVLGPGPDGWAWRIGIEDPLDPTENLAVVEVVDGGIATTSRRRRHWMLADGSPVHHVIDPRTGTAAHVPRTSATVLAATAVDAEVGATAAFLDGPSVCFAPALATLVVTVVDDAAVAAVGGPHRDLVALLEPPALAG